MCPPVEGSLGTTGAVPGHSGYTVRTGLDGADWAMAAGIAYIIQYSAVGLGGLATIAKFWSGWLIVTVSLTCV